MEKHSFSSKIVESEGAYYLSSCPFGQGFCSLPNFSANQNYEEEESYIYS